MASVVGICNGALNQLGATTILSLTEDSKNARLCNSRYDQVRDALFRTHPWNCLQKRIELALDTSAPTWGFKDSYTLPADGLRLVRILDYDTNYKVEGRKVLSNRETMKILYVSRVTDPNEYDELLRETISACLDSDISYAITANLQVTKLMTEKYGLKLSEARHTDASEGYNTDPTLGNTDQVITEDFLNSRY